MDGSIGQAAYDQALAFKQKVKISPVIITKLDGHAKGGGALSAVAATKSPIVFIGTGEHIDDFDLFQTRPFVSKLLGMGDMEGLLKKIKDVVPAEEQPQLVAKFSQGVFTLRDMYDQFQNVLKMGPINKVIEMLPGMGNLLKQAPGVDSNMKVRVFMTIMDSMTDKELDDSKVLSNKTTRDSRISRIARGSGRSVKEVNELLDQYKHFEKMMKKVKGMKLGKSGQIAPRNLSQVTNMLPPQLMKQIGGYGALQNWMKSMGNMNLNNLGDE